MKNKAITLISLVITIVVLIILASVAIYLGLSNNGIFSRAKEAKEQTNKQTATEIINLKITTAQMNKYAEKQEMPTLKELSVALRDDNEIQYVTEKSQIASTKYEVGENPSSIFTKLNDYPYEFEINGSLQLASINGIKIGTSESQDGENACNPKLLTKLTLPYSGVNYRNIGKYYANKTFEKENTNILDNYLSYNDENGWIVQKSGNYLINSEIFAGAPSTTQTSTLNYITLNNDPLKLNGISVMNGYTDYLTSNTTLYLEKGTNINFYSNIENDNSNWHGIYFLVYALFE